jgi:hypothetical protein
MTPTEKAIRDFCGHHADWWPSTTQVQEMLALAQTEQDCVGWFGYDTGLRLWFEANKGDDGAIPLYKDPQQRPWVGLTDDEIKEIVGPWGDTPIKGYTRTLIDKINAKLKENNT